MTYVPVKCECGCVFWSSTSHCPNCNAPVKPQARPIDANALIAEQCGQCDGACEMFDVEKCLACKSEWHCDLREAIDNAPTLDYAPVRHGYWIPVWYDLFKLGYVKCSVCGHKEKKRGFAYCHCGALMDGKEDAHG